MPKNGIDDHADSMNTVFCGVEALVFDLGNVLVDFDHGIAARRISQFCDKKPQEIFDLFFASGLTTLFEAGKIHPQDFYLKVKDMLELRLGYDSFVPIWNEIFFLSKKNQAVYALINKLSRNYKTALASNINILHYEYLKKEFPVFDVFHEIFTSFELGAVKPDHFIYRKILASLGARPENVFYTDDRMELVESARQLGIKAYPFIGIKQLKNDLIVAGINIS